MDVSATGPAVAVAASKTSVETVTGTIAPEAQPTPAPVTSAAVILGPEAGTQTSPAPLPGGSSKTLAPAVAKLFAVPQPAGPISLDVSYRVDRDPNVIVTVFTDPKTGQEVAQFPPEVLVHLAQFFDQPTGVTLDQNA